MAATLAPRQADLYAAEAETIGSLGLRWTRLTSAQAYVDALIGSAWFFERWPWFVRCTVERRGSGSRWSTCSPLDANGPAARPTEGVVLLAAGCLVQPVLLHELSHLLVPRDAGHGVDFARTLLVLVRHEMGFFAFAEFAHALRSRDSFRDLEMNDAG